MSKLPEIKALERDLFIAGLPSDNALKLIAALEAVEKELALAERTFSGFADEDLMVTGACVSIRAAITEALQ